DALAALATDPAAGLRAAAALGVAGAVPALDDTRWPAQARDATRALTARKATLAGLAPATDSAARTARAIDRLHAILGGDLPVTYRLPALGATGASCLADRAALVGGDPTEPVSWLARIAAVRPRVETLEGALFVADAIAPGDPSLSLAVVQQPHVTGDAWI